jgi:hypothetical protein
MTRCALPDAGAAAHAGFENDVPLQRVHHAY